MAPREYIPPTIYGPTPTDPNELERSANEIVADIQRAINNAGNEPVAEPDPWELLRELYEASLFVAPKFGKSNLMNITRKVNAALKRHDAERNEETDPP